jgi:hypothetical protein
LATQFPPISLLFLWHDCQLSSVTASATRDSDHFFPCHHFYHSERKQWQTLKKTSSQKLPRVNWSAPRFAPIRAHMKIMPIRHAPFVSGKSAQSGLLAVVTFTVPSLLLCTSSCAKFTRCWMLFFRHFCCQHGVTIEDLRNKKKSIAKC